MTTMSWSQQPPWTGECNGDKSGWQLPADCTKRLKCHRITTFECAYHRPIRLWSRRGIIATVAEQKQQPSGLGYLINVAFDIFSREQVETLREKYAIYIVGSGRINVAGLYQCWCSSGEIIRIDLIPTD